MGSLSCNPSKIVYLIGIGGIGMSALCQVLYHQHRHEYTLQGSDPQENDNTRHLLATLGIQIFKNQDGSHITSDIHLIVASNAISESNPELRRAKELGIRVMGRGEMLAQLLEGHNCIVIAGTHGKTTTTSLIGHVLHSAGHDPTIINGGIMQNYRNSILLSDKSAESSSAPGSGQWYVVEGDESDGTMSLLPRRISVITNIDLDHMNYYKTEENLLRAFTADIMKTIAGGGGLVVMCTDCPRVARIYQQLSADICHEHVITYGFKPAPSRNTSTSHVHGLNPGVAVREPHAFGMHVDIRFQGSDGGSSTWNQVFVPLHGLHNLQNLLATAAVARHIGLSENEMRAGLASFLGTERRFTVLGVVDGVTLVDDYAHHPAEIKNTLTAARNLLQARVRQSQETNRPHGRGHLIVVHQPHRFTRVKNAYEEYMRCFYDADLVILLPIYSAGEQPLPGIDSATLSEDIKAAATAECVHMQVKCVDNSSEEVGSLLSKICRNGDVVICCGSGDITNLAHQLPAKLKIRDDN